MKGVSQITVRTALFASLLLGGWALAGAQSNDQSTPQPDNTKMNQGDDDPNAVTADQQGKNKSDRDITQQVRKAIIADKSLSTGPRALRRREASHCRESRRDSGRRQSDQPARN
jgi:hypothetical protein